MVRSTLACLTLLIFAGCASFFRCPCRETVTGGLPSIWVIGEGFRIDPITGRLREHQRLDGDPIPSDLDYTRHNLAWNADAGLVTLSAVRNEVVACQILIPGPATGVTVAAADLVGPSGA